MIECFRAIRLKLKGFFEFVNLFRKLSGSISGWFCSRLFVTVKYSACDCLDLDTNRPKNASNLHRYDSFLGRANLNEQPRQSPLALLSARSSTHSNVTIARV